MIVMDNYFRQRFVNRLSVLLVLLIWMVSCGKTGDDVDAAKPARSSSNALKSFSSPATLYQTLPEDTIYYIRYPSVLGFLSSPKNNDFSKALANPKHGQVIQQLRKAVTENLRRTNTDNVGLLDLMISVVRAPVEVAELPLVSQGASSQTGVSSNTGRPVPVITLVRTRLAVKNVDEFVTLIEKMRGYKKRLKIVTPVGSDGVFHLRHFGKDYRGQINFKNGQVSFVSGYNLDSAAFTKVHARLKAVQGPLQKIEAKMESSRHGFFIWVNGKHKNGQHLLRNTLPLITKSFDPTLIAYIRHLAFSWGVHNNKSRIKLHMDTAFPLSQYLPAMGKLPSLQASGQIDYVFGFALPGSQQWILLEPVLKSNKHYLPIQSYIQNNLGSSVSNMLEAIGPAVLVFSDEAGTFSAIQISDKTKFKALLRKLKQKSHSRYKKKSRGKRTVHEIVLPLAAKKVEQLQGAKTGKQTSRRIKIHIYWIEESNYLLVSQLPQQLTERLDFTRKTSLTNWLQQKQRQDTKNATIILSVGLSQSQKKVYYQYLTVLQLLSDMYDAKIDISSLPGAKELGLSGDGTMGLQMNIDKGAITLELVFEKHPLEFILLDSTLTTVLLLGQGNAITGGSVPAGPNRK
jgi:hypothetical protein